MYIVLALVVGFLAGRLYQRSKTVQTTISNAAEKIKDAAEDKYDELTKKTE